jgi:UDP-N-acetylmuramate: L-alanyl-gamma-D-glutamyl-meso-diaminopimelate ligase
MHIHLVGIAGSMTAPLAIALKKQGHVITGSDQDKSYPPYSQELIKAKISINDTPINSEIDLAIIGSSYLSFKKTKEDFENIKNQQIPYISATQYISKYLIKKNSILVAGSFGKTTISTAGAYLLNKANFNPSYMFGGQSLNKLESLHFSSSDWSLIEADESINGLDTQAKFLYYPVKYLILSSATWEHKESYRNEKENFTAFQKLIENLPQDGILIYNQNEASIVPLLPYAKCKKIPYQQTKIKNILIGKYNQENLGAVETLAKELNISSKVIVDAISTFKGVKRRLELSAETKDIKFIDDFAQGATRIKAALKAVKDNFPTSRLKVFYEAHASFMQYRSNLEQLCSVFDKADEIVIFQLKFSSKINAKDRISAKDFLKIIPNSLYLPLAADVIKHYKNSLKSGDILIHFSSGGTEGQKTYQQIINLYKNK